MLTQIIDDKVLCEWPDNGVVVIGDARWPVASSDVWPSAAPKVSDVPRHRLELNEPALAVRAVGSDEMDSFSSLAYSVEYSVEKVVGEQSDGKSEG
jgi:hypothetical protein